jgi:tetratricopeptide (TPR) repeat protein
VNRRLARPARWAVALIVALVAGCAASVSIAGERTTASSGGASPDPLIAAVTRYADEDAEYWRRVDEYVAARAEGRALSEREKRGYANAYVYYGAAFSSRGDARSAARCFGQAIEIDPRNALPRYCLGVLYRRYGGFAPAIDNFRAAAQLGGPLQSACATQLDEIARSLDEQAKALSARGSYIDAARCYEFLAQRYAGAVKDRALKQLKAAEDEVKAERLLVEARRLLGMGRESDGRKLLKELLTTYSWTRAAETAKRIYRGDGSLEVKVKTDSPAGEYAAREKWIDLETANCIVYYKSNEQAKLVAKRVEETLARVTAQLEYSDLDWHKRKCKVFVFDDAATWSEFVKKSGAATEWADGFAYGPLREVYLHAGDPEDMLDRVLPHELTHVIHREYVREDTYLPLWLLEGLACANQFSGKEVDYALVRNAVASGRLIPLAQLTAYRDYPGGSQVNLFYAESLTLVEFILDRFGHEGLAALHKRLRKDTEFDKLVKRAFKMEPEDFEREWLEYVRTKK